MLYPSIQEITKGRVNRYCLVIAAAKCARHITDKMFEEREYAEKHKDLEFLPRETFADFEVRKPVSIAVQKLAAGDYSIAETPED